MLEKRIIVCLDVREGKTTKGIKFQGNVDIGDPVEMARSYYHGGVDELVFYDITASSEHRSVMLDVVTEVARQIFVPFSVGGGIATVDQMRRVLLAGAEKVSVNSQAVKDPLIIDQGAAAFGNQCVVLGMDVQADDEMPSGYRVVINGGRTPTDRDALQWALEAVDRGAGEIVLNSIDADGTTSGYDCRVTRLISEAVSVPVVASGGAGTPQHVAEVFRDGSADAALVASMVHYGSYSIADIKRYLADDGIAVRLDAPG